MTDYNKLCVKRYLHIHVDTQGRYHKQWIAANNSHSLLNKQEEQLYLFHFKFLIMAASPDREIMKRKIKRARVGVQPLM